MNESSAIGRGLLWWMTSNGMLPQPVASLAVNRRLPARGGGHSVTGNGPLLNSPCRSRSDRPPYLGTTRHQAQTSTTRPSLQTGPTHLLHAHGEGVSPPQETSARREESALWQQLSPG